MSATTRASSPVSTTYFIPAAPPLPPPNLLRTNSQVHQQQISVRCTSESGDSSEDQTPQSKLVSEILDFLQIPFARRHSAQKELAETLNSALDSKVPISLAKEIITGSLGRDILALLPGNLASKQAQMRLLVSYVMTLPTEVAFDLDGIDPNSLHDDAQKDLLKMAQELTKLRAEEPSLRVPDTESDNSFKWIDGKDENNNVISFYRKTEDGRHLLFFHHFGDKSIDSYKVDFPHESYFPSGKFVRSVQEVYHTDSKAFGGVAKRSEAIKVTQAPSGATLGFTLPVSPFSTTILCLTVDEKNTLSPSVIPPPPEFCNEIMAFSETILRDKQGVLEISLNVQDQISSAATAHLKIDDTFTIHYGNNYNIFDLNPKELACLYYILHSYLQNKIATTTDKASSPHISIFRTITFDILDYCLRLAVEDKVRGRFIVNQLKKYNDPILNKAIASLEMVLHPNFSSVFHSFVSVDKSSDPISFRTSAIALHARGEKKSDAPRKLKVWKISLENSNNSVGGLAAVVKASAVAHKKMDFESVHSIHPLYGHEKNPLGDARSNLKFKGVIRHEYNGEMVTSSIYRDINRVTGVKEYLIQPDSRYKSMFDIRVSKNVYGGFYFSSRFDRYLYVASAAAAAAAAYSGKTGLKSVDVLQADAWHSGSAAMELIVQYLNPMRVAQNLKPLAMVHLTHMLMADLFEQGRVNTAMLEKIGIDAKGHPHIASLIERTILELNMTPFNANRFSTKTNLTKRALINSSANIFVSHGVARDAIDQDSRLSMGLQASTLAGNPGKVQGITNGIDTETFDITKPKSSGNYAVTDGNFRERQMQIKVDLHRAGIIAHPTKTLAVFIGRFSDEKGIEMLPAVVEQVKKEGGQIVIMGLFPDANETGTSAKIIKELFERSKTEDYQDCLKVYMDLKEQLDPFILDGKAQGLRKGWAIRQASSIAIVPSFSEACGLVPLEMQCTGALTIAPYHQGLRDMNFPIDAAEDLEAPKSYTLEDGGNAFCYADPHNVGQLQEAIRLAFVNYSSLSDTERNSLMKKIHAYAMANNDWVVMENGLPVRGAAYEYSKTYHAVFHGKAHVAEVETFEDALIRRQRAIAAQIN